MKGEGDGDGDDDTEKWAFYILGLGPSASHRASCISLDSIWLYCGVVIPGRSARDRVISDR
jgi:hypothetical protein